jgi:hypothetical protein
MAWSYVQYCNHTQRLFLSNDALGHCRQNVEATINGAFFSFSLSYFVSSPIVTFLQERVVLGLINFGGVIFEDFFKQKCLGFSLNGEKIMFRIFFKKSHVRWCRWGAARRV